MGAAKDTIESNIRVWNSLLRLVKVDIFFKLLTLFRIKCQAAGASTVRYGDVTQTAMHVHVRGLRGGVTQAATDVTVRYGDLNQAATNVQIRGLRGVVIQAAMDVQVRGLGLDLSCNSEGLCRLIESLSLNTLLPISSAADIWIIQNKTMIVR